MRLRAWWRRRSIFHKTFIFLVLLITVVVGLVEGVLEPVSTQLLLRASGGFEPWHEVILWGVGIIFPSLVCGYIFSRVLARKLDGMAATAAKLARGDFSARLEKGDNAGDAFGRLSASFNNMASSLEKLLANERRLLADISHELRSPLARMGLSLELLPMKEGAAREELIGRLEKEIAAMNGLMGLLLDQGRERLSHENASLVDLSALFAEVADDIRFQGQVDNKDTHCDIAENLSVHGPAGQLRAMLMNVAANALSYTPSGESVRMRLERTGDRVVILVRDFGPGVPEEQLQDIFRAFYRVDDSRSRASGGAGLGLALAREAVERCGGTIAARNTFPGLEVRIELPPAV